MEETKLIELSVVSQQTGIPIETLLSAVKSKRMWGVKIEMVKRGRTVQVWHTAQIEVERFRAHWRKHQLVKNE